MCGLTAVLALEQSHDRISNTQQERSALGRQIEASLEIVKHRGPDAQGQWISRDGRVGLGHVRLSIIDLSPEGNQPFHDSADEIHAVVNGELYDHERYRADLGKDYEFKGHSDCENLLALYRRYGLSLTSHLRGEFSFVLYDSKRRLLFAGRDRYGIKPLYYTVVNGRLLIASEMKSFLGYGWQPEWDLQALLDNGWRHDSRTLFKGVRKIMPGYELLCRNFDAIETRPYWDLDYPDKRIRETRTEEEMVLEVRERLLEAVRLRLRADVPVGIYLSGGLDSSAVAGMVAHLMREKKTKLGNDDSHDLSRMKCFTVQFGDKSGEADVAQRTAEWLGVKFSPIPIDDELVAQKFEDTIWFAENPAPDIDGPSRLAMAEMVHREGLKVVLTGEGSDEHFAGYPMYERDLLREPDPSWPSNISEADRLKAHRAANVERASYSLGALENDQLASTARMLNHTVMSQMVITAVPRDFMADWMWQAYPDSSQETIIAESHNGCVREKMANKWHPMNTSAYVWTKTMFPTWLLRYCGDNVDLCHAVESRTPFLDHYVTEYANSLPPSLKMRYNVDGSFTEKHLLKQAVKPFVTDEVYNRKKHPFLGPTQIARDGPLHKLFERLVTRDNVAELGFVDWDKAKVLLEKTLEGDNVFAFRSLLVVAQFVVLHKRFGVKKVLTPDGQVADGHK